MRWWAVPWWAADSLWLQAVETPYHAHMWWFGCGAGAIWLREAEA
ncbi:MAG: hypothetical protein WKG00_03450 [Polyangiaceae bacterium]